MEERSAGRVETLCGIEDLDNLMRKGGKMGSLAVY